jgi:hypothetical protein
MYCTEHWSSHLRDADLSSIDSISPRTLQLYDTSSTTYLWFFIYWATTHRNRMPPSKMNATRLTTMLGHWRTLEKILQENEDCDINQKDEDDNTALMWASGSGYEEVLQILIDAGADVNDQGGEYGKALQVASVGGHEKVLEMLLKKGADVKAERGYYGYALQAASDRGHEKVVEMPLKVGPDVNAQGGDYGDALQAALVEGHEKVVQILRGKMFRADGEPL